MTQLLARDKISAPFPNPDNGTARQALGVMWDFINEMSQSAEYDITCAATLNIGAQASARLRLTGSAVTITSLGTVYRGAIYIRSSGSYAVTHNATSLLCPGGRNLTLSAGDLIVANPKASTSGIHDGWQISVLSRGNGGGLFGGTVRMIGSTPLVFEGANDDSYKTTVNVTEPTANRTVKIPDADVDLTNVRAWSPTYPGVVQAASGAEVLAALEATKAVTPAGLNWPRAFAVNGYQRLPGSPGLLIQWGQSALMGDVPGGTYSMDLTFPIAFSNPPMFVIPAFSTASGGINYSLTVYWDRGLSSTTTVRIKYGEIFAGVQSSWYMSYLAIGYAD